MKVRPRSRFFNDFFKDLSTGYLVRPLHGDALPDPSQIKIEVKDTGESYIVHADLPGVKKQDIQVHIEKSVVTLSAEITQEDTEVCEGKLIHSERYDGSISRSFVLPSEVDDTKSKAKYENGVLTLTLPKHIEKNIFNLKIE